MSHSIANTGSPGLQSRGVADRHKRPRASRLYKPVFRACVALSLLLILFTWFDFSGIVENLKSIDARLVVLALIILAVQFALSLFRWIYILRLQRMHIGWREAFSIYGAGTLANLFLVTSIAGLSVRAALLVRSGSGVSGAVASLAAERIAAVAGLALCGMAGLVVAFPHVRDYVAVTEFAPWLDTVLIGAVVVCIGAALALARIAPIRNFIALVARTFASAGSVILLATVSTGIVLLGFAAMAVLSIGMGLEVEPVFFISVMPAVALVSALPISVGGWGVREGMVVAGLAIFSVPAEAAIALSISYGLAGLLVAALLGGMSTLTGVFNRVTPGQQSDISRTRV